MNNAISFFLKPNQGRRLPDEADPKTSDGIVIHKDSLWQDGQRLGRILNVYSRHDTSLAQHGETEISYIPVDRDPLELHDDN